MRASGARRGLRVELWRRWKKARYGRRGSLEGSLLGLSEAGGNWNLSLRRSDVAATGFLCRCIHGSCDDWEEEAENTPFYLESLVQYSRGVVLEGTPAWWFPVGARRFDQCHHRHNHHCQGDSH